MTKKLFDKNKFPEKSILEEFKELIKPNVKELECIQVGITSFCSGRCEYCPRAIQENSWISHHMTPECYGALWELMKNSQRIHLQGWGEPLLHPHFFEFVELARRADCRVSTTSCGLVMNEDIAKKIVKSGIDVIAFSLAGTDEETNSSRNKVPFTKVVENIKLLQKIRKEMLGVHLEVHIAYLALGSQIDALKQMPELMKELGVHGIVISTLDCDADYNKYAIESFQPNEEGKIEALRKVISEIEPKILEQDMKIHYQLPNPIPSNRCREHAHATCYVDSKGILSPCIYLNLPIENSNLKHMTIGDINTCDSLELWDTASYQYFRSLFSENSSPPICAECPKRFES